MELQCGIENAIDISSLYTGLFSDCVVKSCDGFEFKLHRNILAVHSDVFKAMLLTDMQEGITSVITLSENNCILSRLFYLMYHGKFVGHVEDFLQLLVTTKKYLMLSLHERLFPTIFDHIDEKSAVDVLVVAHANDFYGLKEEALKCIVDNFGYIRQSDKWNMLMDDNEIRDIVIDEYIKHGNQSRSSSSESLDTLSS